MEQEKEYVPSQERDVQQLRADINAKAQKMEEDDPYGQYLLFVSLFGVFEALNVFFGWFPHHLWIWVTFAIAMIIMIFMTWLRHRSLADMLRADGIEQHRHAAKRFARITQASNIMSFPLAYLFVSTTLSGMGTKTLMATLLIMAFYLIWLLFKPNSYIDRDFYDNVKELGEYIADK